MTPVRLEPAALRSRVKHSTTEPLRSPHMDSALIWLNNVVLNDCISGFNGGTENMHPADLDLHFS